ncbi:DUF3108 domain-containing protein [Falsigemmobacter intermedius]|uniref:DUF3108 domain-containing protein n=1 Tax=Falsigemmobacter intermedius TaxID=1553448 RepID=A0A444ME49_9RHOB|nr:DUF3108 domain-containing protein [Falsigemmobacter intermedius]RWY43083.1 DUF3108 domain-containing protein [Falsigemmobacter intermedius]
MTVFSRLKALTLFAGIALSAVPAAAETRQEARFDLEIRGIRMGQLVYSAVEKDGSYAISGTVQTTGLAGMLRKMRYDAKVQGRITSRGYAPVRYDQSGGAGNRYSEETVTWSGGVPRITRREPPRSPGGNDADPARQRGTVDTLTTIYATLRDVPQSEACKSGLVMFDGRYRMELQLSRAQPARDGGVTCNGAYIRREGFSAAEMAERVQFPFTLHYRPDGAGNLRVAQVTMESLYGNARLVRR